MVSVPAGINEVVDTLYLNGVQQSPGVYGSTTSPATNQNDTYFEGGGTLTVGSTFATWLAANAPATGFNTDSDDDGVPNGVENVLGTSPNTSSAGLTQSLGHRKLCHLPTHPESNHRERRELFLRVVQ
ncbi:MAG: hypothetical protein HC767_04915 [Akkermansiaceae bacterium]|nr:hypothetical protein [Akkermansiaceae bacterium]